jgi:type II secretory pathway pseudopilin PulG
MKTRLQKQKGYTLIEIIVYLAIFTATSILVINSFVLVISSFNMTRINRDILEAGSNVMERISREIRQATAVDIAGSTFGTSPGVLSLTTGSTIDNFMVSSGSVAFYKSGSIVDSLFGTNITVTSLIFRHIVTAEGEAVKIELTLQDTRGAVSKSVNFYNTIIVRGGY